MITTKELRDITLMHTNGMITDAELLIKLQLPPQVVTHVIAWSKLPFAAQDRIDLGDLWDTDGPHTEPVIDTNAVYDVEHQYTQHVATFLHAHKLAFAREWRLLLNRFAHVPLYTSRGQIPHKEFYYVFDFGGHERNAAFLKAVVEALKELNETDAESVPKDAKWFDGVLDSGPSHSVMIRTSALTQLQLRVPGQLALKAPALLEYDSTAKD